MHIPDGYLSPSTCATLYAASTPFWVAGLRRVRTAFSSRLIPLVGVFSAFSFVIMMFNLPLPGGTTGHATGMAVAAIILGPELAVLALSLALLIQALFFGDGGITTFGANCFNMAIVGPLVAWMVYRLVAHGAAVESKRRLFAAGLAGYVAANAAALCAAVEFGIQPLWFHDAAGKALYSPYPLQVAIPAMMLGHLTIAGLAELVLSVGLIRYLQQTNPELIDRSVHDRHASAAGLWGLVSFAALMTPLGILAAGSAWGEWKIKTVWDAPLAEYSPRFIANASAGYLVSAGIGIALIALLTWTAVRILGQAVQQRGAFLEKTLRGLLAAARDALFAEESAKQAGLLQRLDARVKIAGLGGLIIAAVAVRQLWVLIALFVVGGLLAWVSKISLWFMARRIWFSVLAFTGLIALPALFFSPSGALFLLLRAETAATFAALAMLSTPWNTLLHALRVLGLPREAVALAGLTYRYLFVLIDSAQGLLEARQTRLVGRLGAATQRRLAAASVGALFETSVRLSADVHLAMQARGFRGDIRLLDRPRMQWSDWLQLAALLTVACAAIVWGR